MVGAVTASATEFVELLDGEREQQQAQEERAREGGVEPG